MTATVKLTPTRLHQVRADDPCPPWRTADTTRHVCRSHNLADACACPCGATRQTEPTAHKEA